MYYHSQNYINWSAGIMKSAAFKAIKKLRTQIQLSLSSNQIIGA